MDVIRAIAHFIVLVCLLYLAFDERAAGRQCRAWVWAALAVERLAFLLLLAVDVSQNGAIWMEWRANLTPFIFVVAVALSVYVINRIRGKRKLRNDIAPLLGVYG
jgi:uncharacterized membrane protein YoaK (UPF0700 family)